MQATREFVWNLATRPLAEAISTAGGVRLESLDGSLMLKPTGRMPAGAAEDAPDPAQA